LRDFYDRRLIYWGAAAGRSHWFVEQLSFCETISLYWHQLRPLQRTNGRCAGCGLLLFGCRDLWRLPNGAEVHGHLDCISRYGRQWRSQAIQDLAQLQIFPPTGFQP
jgi:hypothetical protein